MRNKGKIISQPDKINTKSPATENALRGGFEMGTRADFYVGRGVDAEWLGSIAWDGYPNGIADKLLGSESESDFRNNLDTFFSDRDDVTLPENGWPWPWDDSNTTDYAYAFDGGKVHASGFGSYWFDPLNMPDDEPVEGDAVVFPNMKDIKNVTFGYRSGVILVTAKP